MRSAFAPASLAFAALIASLVRWWLQGSSNLYTATSKVFYVEDPDLGWHASTDHAIWLGLEVCGLVAAVAVGLAIGGFVIRRRERRSGRTATVLRAVAWVAAVLPLAVPVAAFASGLGPAGARDTMPSATSSTPAATRPSDAPVIAGAIAAPAGTYAVVAHDGTMVTAQVASGGERFDARFASGITGEWSGDPGDLAKPMRATVKAAVDVVDTGIGLRSKHAREDYLHADRFPTMAFTLDKLVGASQAGTDKLAFRAAGSLEFMGKRHAIDVTGTLRKPDGAALQRLGLTGDVLLVQADFALAIKDSGLAENAGDLEGDHLPIHISLVLRHNP